MKFKICYEYFEIADIDWFEPDVDSIRFIDKDGSDHWVPKYMIKKIIPLIEDVGDEKDH